MAGNNDSGRMVLFIVIAIIVILFIFFIAWWMMAPRTIVIPDCIQKQIGQLGQLTSRQVALTREYSLELILNSAGADVTRDLLYANLDKSIPIVYGKDAALVAKELNYRKVVLLGDAVHGGDLPTIEKELLEINTKLSTLFVQRLPQNLREEKGKQMLSILTKYDTALLAMSLQYQQGKYVESFASYDAAIEAMHDYTKLAIWALVTVYSHDPTVA